MNSDDLPSWVFFPDKERAEWVNNIMKQLWPYVNEYVFNKIKKKYFDNLLMRYVRDLLFTTVEPAVEDALKGFKLSPFKFDRDRVFLGQVPPRITGIKVCSMILNKVHITLTLAGFLFAVQIQIKISKHQKTVLNSYIHFHTQNFWIVT